MRLTPRIAVGVALVCGLLAAVLVYMYLRSLQPKASTEPQQPQSVAVVVASVSIPPSTIITADKLKVKQVAFADAPQTAYRQPDEIVGAISMQTLPVDGIILQGQVQVRGPELGLAGIVPPGMRAVTVPVDPVTGVAGLLKAADRVDVVATFDNEDRLLSKTILQDIEVLALGSQTIIVQEEEQPAPAAEGKNGKAAPKEAPPADSASAKDKKVVEYPNATLSVTPDDANKLVLALERGKIRLILRPIGEHDYLPVATQDMSTVLGPAYAKLHPKKEEPIRPATPPATTMQSPMPAPQPYTGMPYNVTPRPSKTPKPVPEVEIIRGGEREKIVP